MRILVTGIFTTLTLLVSFAANATLVSITPCSGANSCDITTTPPDPISPDPNNGILLAWDEVQNVTLTTALRVDRVFDATASFISDAGGGDFFIAAGTIVSSHYVEWDPGNNSSNTVTATINLDSQVFAFITSDQNLFDSDAALGLPGLDYADFGLRGLEAGDTTSFNGANTDISWGARSPGDWTRLITAFSPAAAVSEPATTALLALGLLGAGFAKKRRTH